MALIEVNYKGSTKKLLGAFKKEFEHLTTLIMGKFEDVKQEFENLKTAVAQEKVEIQEKLTELSDKITQLETNIVEGGTTEERAALIADIKAETAGIQGIINKPTPPPVEEV